MKTSIPAATWFILKEKSLDAYVDERWINWAADMIAAGYEAMSLYELAGICKPYNQFELKDLTDQVLRELGFDWSDQRKVLYDYAYYLVVTAMDKPEDYSVVLDVFRELYYESACDPRFLDMALLCWAKDDLLYSEYQSYWEGADRNNIDRIIREQFVLMRERWEAENRTV